MIWLWTEYSEKKIESRLAVLSFTKLNLKREDEVILQQKK